MRFDEVIALLLLLPPFLPLLLLLLLLLLFDLFVLCFRFRFCRLPLPLVPWSFSSSPSFPLTSLLASTVSDDPFASFKEIVDIASFFLPQPSSSSSSSSPSVSSNSPSSFSLSTTSDFFSATAADECARWVDLWVPSASF